MAEQYVYTRAQSERGTASGFTCRTEGVVGAVQKEIQSLALTDHTIRDFAGEFLPVWEKLALSGRQDKVILQLTRQKRTAEGIIQTSSGYVLDLKEELLVHPAAWGGLDYQIQPEQLSLAPVAVPLKPLDLVLEFFQITPEQFLQLLKSCFDAKVSGTVTLIGVDFSRTEAIPMGNQLMLWIFSLLPHALRRELNYTTCYQGPWNSGYHLGLVASSLLEQSGGQVTGFYRSILGQGGTIFYRGQVDLDQNAPHMGYPAENSIYSQWLEAAIHQARFPGKVRAEQILANVDAVYRGFDRMIYSLPEEDRFRSNYYDALCWNLMQRGGAQRKGGVDRHDLACFEDLLAFGSWPSVIDSLEGMLDALEQSSAGPASPQLIRLMTKMVLLDGAEGTLGRARELLSAFLARDMEAADMGESSAISARYLQLMTDSGMERSAALHFLGRVFFPDSVPPEADPALWDRIGTSRLAKEGLRRCNDWMIGYVNVCLNAEELIECADTVLRELNGMTNPLLEQAMDCLLGAQETRSYYAKLEILPAHLQTCVQCISGAWTRAPEAHRLVAERYYNRLLKLLCRQYISYWTGRNDLCALCNLANSVPQNSWTGPEHSYLRELALAQCADICEYDWEKLKLQLNGEDSAILQRLWQVMDFLEALQLHLELRNQLTRQVCRYVLHRVPAYVNDDWIVCEVREREDLRREGYYLELLTIRTFLQGKEQTLERLQYCIKLHHLPGELMNDMTKFLYRVFHQGGMSRLSLPAIEGFYIASRERLKISQLEVFRAVCRVRGGDALIELLHCWPTAPMAENLSVRQQKHTQALRREAAYPWLKTNQSLMDALARLSQDHETLTLAARGSETFYMDLAQAIEDLAPVGTKARPLAVKICTSLLTRQEAGAGVKIRMLCNSRKRRLQAE